MGTLHLDSVKQVDVRSFGWQGHAKRRRAFSLWGKQGTRSLLRLFLLQGVLSVMF